MKRIRVHQPVTFNDDRILRGSKYNDLSTDYYSIGAYRANVEVCLVTTVLIELSLACAKLLVNRPKRLHYEKQQRNLFHTNCERNVHVERLFIGLEMSERRYDALKLEDVG